MAGILKFPLRIPRIPAGESLAMEIHGVPFWREGLQHCPVVNFTNIRRTSTEDHEAIISGYIEAIREAGGIWTPALEMGISVFIPWPPAAIVVRVED